MNNPLLPGAGVQITKPPEVLKCTVSPESQNGNELA